MVGAEPTRCSGSRSAGVGACFFSLGCPAGSWSASTKHTLARCEATSSLSHSLPSLLSRHSTRRRRARLLAHQPWCPAKHLAAAMTPIISFHRTVRLRRPPHSFHVIRLAMAIGFLAKALVLSTALVLASSAIADSWNYKPVKEDQTHEFGPIKVVLTTDATKDRKWPEFTMRVSRAGVMQAQYRGLAFEHLYAAPDHSVFVGLSNSGIPGTAIVVFGPSGELRLLVNHGVAEFDYCEKSTTLERKWFDAERPDIKFGDKESKPSGISLRDCRGNRVDLWAVALKAYNNASQGTPANGRR